MITQTVAFRVIRTVEDANQGRIPVWGLTPLTLKGASILRGLVLSDSTQTRTDQQFREMGARE